MKKIDIKQIWLNPNNYENKEVVLGGWAKTVRDLKNFGFIELTDGTCFKSLQVVFENGLSNYDAVAKLNTGSSLIVKGVLICSAYASRYSSHCS